MKKGEAVAAVFLICWGEMSLLAVGSSKLD